MRKQNEGRPNLGWEKPVETIQRRKLFKGGNYSRAETIQGRHPFKEIQYNCFRLIIESMGATIMGLVYQILAYRLTIARIGIG